MWIFRVRVNEVQGEISHSQEDVEIAVTVPEEESTVTAVRQQ